MTEKELQKLRRVELLEMLFEQGKEVNELRKRIQELENQLQERTLCLARAGNIAEASLQINGVFEAAQAAAHQYLVSVESLSAHQEEMCAEMERQTEEKCIAMEKETRERCETLEKETEEKCRMMQEEAEKDVEQRWAEISERLEEFYSVHKGLRELLAMAGKFTLDQI